MERRYRMTRLPGGDWIFLANDGRTVCRVGSYMEDGSAENGRGGYITGRRWIAWHFNGTPDYFNATLDVNEDAILDRWDPHFWREVAYMERTRAEAIAAALKAPERVAAMQEP